MHPCLGVDEILRLLACELVVSEAEATAVSLACCCKSFEDPVLDALWETQDRLIPLLKCFPQEVWNEKGGSFCFKRIPTKAEWADFRKHARRMRNLKLDTSEGPVASHVLLAIQLRTAGKLFLPRLKTFECEEATETFIPFIPLFLSPKTTEVIITFARSASTVAVGSMISRFTTLCPDLERITLENLPRDSVIVDAVSEMVLACNGDTLKYFLVDSPLTEEARKVVYQLQKLKELWSVIQEPALLPPVILPDLTLIDLEFGDYRDWLLGFRGAVLGGLERAFFRCGSEQIGGFLEAFERVALTTSTPATLLKFGLLASTSWNPDYRSLLPFGQLRFLMIEFPCDSGCSSSMDDDIIIDLARAMRKLEILQLGRAPCRAPGGVTGTGLIGLAYHCPHLSELCLHFRATTLVNAAAIAVTQSPYDNEPVVQRGSCVPVDLEVGEIPVPEGLGSMVASTLLQIFPSIRNVKYANREWKTVVEAIKDSRRIGALAHPSETQSP